MTVNKITNAPTNNEVINKINEVIDNLGGTSITIDDTLSTTSTNPVQNKVITTELNKKIEGISSSDVTTALGYTPYNSTNPDNFINSSALAPYELINKPVTTLANSGTLTLADNTAYKIANASGAITFTLPTVTDLTVLHRIEIELNMSTAQTIDLGLGSTPNWFNETELDLSEAGTYNILYQYSPSKSAWYCGGAKIGSAS